MPKKTGCSEPRESVAVQSTRHGRRPADPERSASFTFMKKYTPLIVAALLASLFVGCSKRPAHGAWTSSASIVIEPGVAIGPVRSGMSIQQVVAELGEPDQKKDSALEYLNLGFSVIPGKGEVVHIVLCVDSGGTFTKAFAGRTKEGIGIGSSRADVISAYGEPTATESIDGKPGFEVLRYKPLGLMLEIGAGKVYSIAVIFKPTP